MENEGRCHIYSLPYQFECFLHLNNSFQGVMFDKVRYLMTTRPFEHQLFKLISQDFTSLTELYIWNNQPKKDKQQTSTLITFPHLIFLHLGLIHVDYTEQFLFDKNTHFITVNFSSDQTKYVEYNKIPNIQNLFFY
jgi:hypothetical protein